MFLRLPLSIDSFVVVVFLDQTGGAGIGCEGAVYHKNQNKKPGYFIFFRIWFIADLLFMDHFHGF